MERLTTKLEEGLKACIEANYQEDGDLLEDVPIFIGTRSGVLSAMDHMIVTATEKGGELAFAGIPEVEVQLLLLTYAVAQDGEDAELPAERHTSRAHALREIVSQAQMATVCNALNELEAGFGVSCYNMDSVEEGKSGQAFATSVTLTFTAHLA